LIDFKLHRRFVGSSDRTAQLKRPHIMRGPTRNKVVDSKRAPAFPAGQETPQGANLSHYTSPHPCERANLAASAEDVNGTVARAVY
jgi:hypothetical protein